MYDVDMELRLLSYDPIDVDGVPVQHVSIDKIQKFGLNRYNNILSYLTIPQDRLDSFEKDGVENRLTPCSFLYISAAANPKFWDDIRSGFELFCGSLPLLDDSSVAFIFPNFTIHENNFGAVQEMIRVRNGVKRVAEADENPSNERARQLLQRRREVREMLAKAKHKEADALNLADLVSIFASFMRLPISEVMKYDMYQFDDQFGRLKIMDDYQMGVQAILHGAKSEDVDLKHWMCKQQPDEESGT